VKTQKARKKEDPLLSQTGRQSAPTGSDNGDARQRIAVRAYELYRERGCHDGHDFDDWLEAERNILRSVRRTDRETSGVVGLQASHGAQTVMHRRCRIAVRSWTMSSRGRMMKNNKTTTESTDRVFRGGIRDAVSYVPNK
jgi:hypothetical protein